MQKELKNAAPLIEDLLNVFETKFVKLESKITLDYKINQRIITSVFLGELVTHCKIHKLRFTISQLIRCFELSFHLQK